MQKSTLFLTTGLLTAALLIPAVAQAQNSAFSPVALATTTPALANFAEPGRAAESARRLNTPTELAATAAFLYDEAHHDLKQALAWMQETNALHPECWSVYAEARIRLQLKDYSGAKATAEQARKLALAATPPNVDYARRSAEVITQAQAKGR